MAQLGKQGYLMKLGEKPGVFGPSWKERYFVISDSKLLYYKDNRMGKSYGFIDLNEVEIIDVAKEHGRLAFGLKPLGSERTYVIVAKTQVSFEEWLNAIKTRRTTLKQDRARENSNSKTTTTPTTAPRNVSSPTTIKNTPLTPTDKNSLSLPSSPPSSSSRASKGSAPYSPPSLVDRNSLEREHGRQSQEEEEDLSLASLIPEGGFTSESEIKQGAVRVRAAMATALTSVGIPLMQKNTSQQKSYSDSFFGSDAVTWAVENGLSPSRTEAAGIFGTFFTCNILYHVTNEQTFKDEPLLYKWKNASDNSLPALSVSKADESSVVFHTSGGGAVNSGSRDRASSSTIAAVLGRERVGSTIRAQVENVIKEGYLTKLGEGTNVMGLASWKERFFVLAGSKLLYFKNASTTCESYGSIELCAAEMPDTRSEHGPLSFGLKPVGLARTYVMQARTLETREEWVRVIMMTRAKAISLRDSCNEKFTSENGDTLAFTITSSSDLIDLLRAAERMRKAMLKGKNELGYALICDHKGISQTFIGSEVVSWAVNVDIAYNRDMATAALSKLSSMNAFRYVTKENDKEFEDDPNCLYRWENISEDLRKLEETTGKKAPPVIIERTVAKVLEDTLTKPDTRKSESNRNSAPNGGYFDESKQSKPVPHKKDLSSISSSSLSKKQNKDSGRPKKQPTPRVRTVSQSRSPLEVFVDGEDETGYNALDIEEPSRVRRILCCCFPGRRYVDE